MNLRQLAAALPLHLEAGAAALDNEVTGGYAADLLSCAMAGAHPGHLWVTLQGHLNVVAIACLNDLAGIVVTEGKPIAPEAIEKAEAEAVPIFSSPLDTFELVGRLWDLGIRK